MNSKAFKASWIIQLITSILAAVGGVIMIFSPTVFMADEIQGYLGQSWSQLEAANASLFDYFMHDIRLLGFTQLTAAVLLILVILFYYRRQDKAAWYICLVGAALGTGSSLGINIPVGDPAVVTWLAVLLVADLVALALGAKPMLAQGAKA